MRRRWSPAARIALTFAVISAVWILFSDRVLRVLAPELDRMSWLQTAKGWLFVAATAVLIYLLTRRSFRRLTASERALQEAYDATLLGWGRALDLRDRTTGDHTRRVADLTVALARRAGVTGEDLEHVYRGALLHDIGKMGIPDAVLLKPGPLDESEWAVMREHPKLGYDLLAAIDYLAPALDIPLCHHERWDGSGYPRGLAGEEIPLAARLFAVVDVYDAVTSDRPYHRAWDSGRAVEHLRKAAGSHLDPRAVSLFVVELQERGEVA